jgi:battenin
MFQITQDVVVYGCFWAFGLVNNVLYVVILSAALDLVGAEAPKAIVLLADVVPALLCKITAPFYFHLVPYKYRIGLLIGLSFGGMMIIANSDSRFFRLLGIALASASSGLGEVSFLQLTHYYTSWAMAGFSSGTGAAGLVGSFMFLVMTSWIGIATSTSLIVFSLLPFSFAVVYGVILPVGSDSAQYESLGEPESQSESTPDSKFRTFSFFGTVERIKPLVKPFMAPLMLVYIAEYIINQGISPTLLFPLEDMPYTRYRDAYVTYGALYQLGVFISRSSSPFFRLRRLYLPAILQWANLILCVIQSLFVLLPNIYLVMLVIFYEGLLGGLGYVNTFLLVSETVPLSEREFAMGSVGISDSTGIAIAALVSMWLEKALCGYQISTGRPWCNYE